ncbi:MAG: YihA family ribosome biogenesis GTP-binding protein [Zetaproteobacteria bacterium]|nr:MAG: YihA family ribosome biogenesis GTP-binding protein [Zetaproteobacteria bacterium]
MRIRTAELLHSAGRADQFPRGGRPEVAFAGRSNVGKSSLINRLLGRRALARTSSTPGRTRTVNFYIVNDACVFVDLPGYGYAKVSRTVQAEWWALVESYLESRGPLRGVVHLTDARHAPTATDRDLQAFLAAVRVPYLHVLTKADKVPRGRRAGALAATREVLGETPPGPVFFSAETGEGLPDLWRAIDAMLAGPPRTSAAGHPSGG